MVKCFDVKYTVSQTYFPELHYSTTVTVDENDSFYFVRMPLDPWTSISIRFDKNVYSSHDHVFDVFKILISKSYNINI